MSKKRLLLLGAHNGLCDRAHKRKIEYLLIQHPRRSDGLLNQMLDNVLLLDYETSTHLEPMVAAAHAAAPFELVLSNTERGLLPAALLNESINLSATPSSVVELTIDKWLMREHLKSKEFPSLKAKLVNNAIEARSFGKISGYPMILKPRDGVGSLGVRFIEHQLEIDACFVAPPASGLIAEEFADGKEFSAETFSFNGTHIIFGIIQKLVSEGSETNKFVEIGHQVPAPLPSPVISKVRSFIPEFLDVIGIKDGLAHTEFKITSNGLQVIETHNRHCGDHVPDLVRLATGYDLLDYTVAWPMRLIAPLQNHIESVRGAAIRYFQPPPGTVVSSVWGLETMRFEPGVVTIHLPLRPGDRIPLLYSSNDRVGFVIACGRTSDEAVRLCEYVIEQIIINIETD